MNTRRHSRNLHNDFYSVSTLNNKFKNESEILPHLNQNRNRSYNTSSINPKEIERRINETQYMKYVKQGKYLRTVEYEKLQKEAERRKHD